MSIILGALALLLLILMSSGLTYTYGSSYELHEIEQELLPRLEEGRIGFELMPVETIDADEVRWEQLDNFLGLQQARGINGNPGYVKKTGWKSYSLRPGVYGEFELIDEAELTRRRKIGTLGEPIAVDDLVSIAQNKLLQRRLDRIEQIIWTLLSTGTFSVSAIGVGVVHTDTFPILTSTPSVAWSTVATATPVADLRLLRLNSRGRSTNYGRAAKIYMNTKKVTQVLNNTNAADLGKYTQNGGDKLVTIEDVNRILIAQDLPEIVEYDNGYLDEAGTFVPFIGDTKAVLVGPRTSGAPVGSYKMTRNVNNPNMGPGAYSRVIDRGEDTIPRRIEVHDGHNGGPAIEFPGSIVMINC